MTAAFCTDETVRSLVKLTRKDFVSSQEVKWCPGCADHAVLAGVQRLLPELGIARENIVFVSGIGCSSRFPYYMNTYGFHGIHGRPLPIATGIKLANPALSVWVVTGDGDALSIGGNHFIHAMRRNVDIKVLLFDNRIYGLTKGQASPTSEQGKKTRSTPFGSVDRPINPLALALGAGATFVARALATDLPQLTSVLERAARHKGTAFVQILQNCPIFNPDAYETISSKTTRADAQLLLEHGKPLVFGAGSARAIGMAESGFGLALGQAGQGTLVHDEKAQSIAFAMALATLEPPFPQAFGVLRCVELPTLEELTHERHLEAVGQKGATSVAQLLETGDVWTVA
jgi:2-oxoglutarate/2-oxoacid ferredoxin oxidoreductase subunit beta